MASEIDEKIEKVQQSQEKSESRLREELDRTESRIISQFTKQMEAVAQIIRTERIADKEAFSSTIKRMEDCSINFKGRCDRTVKAFEEAFSVNESKFNKHSEEHVRKDDIEKLKKQVEETQDSIKKHISEFEEKKLNPVTTRVTTLESWKSNNWRQIIIYCTAAGIILYKGIAILWELYEKVPKGVKGV